MATHPEIQRSILRYSYKELFVYVTLDAQTIFSSTPSTLFQFEVKILLKLSLDSSTGLTAHQLFKHLPTAASSDKSLSLLLLLHIKLMLNTMKCVPL